MDDGPEFVKNITNHVKRYENLFYKAINEIMPPLDNSVSLNEPIDVLMAHRLELAQSRNENVEVHSLFPEKLTNQ
jgi:hypothetical protein